MIFQIQSQNMTTKCPEFASTCLLLSSFEIQADIFKSLESIHIILKPLGKSKTERRVNISAGISKEHI